MTEAEWLSCTDDRLMISFLFGSEATRKKRLFACGCFRSIWSSLNRRDWLPVRQAVEVAEGLADGAIRKPEATAFLNSISRDDFDVEHPRFLMSSTLLYDDVDRAMWGGAGLTVLFRGMREPDLGRVGLCNLVRCIFGNPFASPIVGLGSLTPAIVDLARRIYDGRAFELMPSLADALEGGGCTNNDILAHCRGELEHARGCWVLDMILGMPEKID